MLCSDVMHCITVLIYYTTLYFNVTYCILFYDIRMIIRTRLCHSVLIQCPMSRYFVIKYTVIPTLSLSRLHLRLKHKILWHWIWKCVCVLKEAHWPWWVPHACSGQVGLEESRSWHHPSAPRPDTHRHSSLLSSLPHTCWAPVLSLSSGNQACWVSSEATHLFHYPIRFSTIDCS